MKVKYIIEDVLSFRYNLLCFLVGLIPIKTIREKYKTSINKKKGQNRIAKTLKRLPCKIGEFSYCDSSVYVGNNATTIGKFCSIGRDVAISAGTHPINRLSTSPYFYCESFGWVQDDEYGKMFLPCHIGNDVWIGHGAFIRDGVNIGDGAVVAAGAVVVNDVPPYAVVGGVPAKIIKYRFDDETIKKLLELKWWDMDKEILKKCPSKDVNLAIEFLEQYKLKR